MSLPIPAELSNKTQALFYEFRHQTKMPVEDIPYNLKTKDWQGTKSMYLIYMQYETEYDAAIALLGSWPHWERLRKAPWFAKHLEEWNAERALRDEALARKTLLNQAREGNVTAAKAILAKDNKRGRPSNKEKEVKDKDADAIDQMHDRLHVLQGGKKK